MSRTECFVAENIRPGFTRPFGFPPRMRGHLTLCFLHRHVGNHSYSFGRGRRVLRRWSRAFPALPAITMTSAETPLRPSPSPFQAQGGRPQVRTHSFIAQPPHLRCLALITRASRFLARSPCSATPSIRFLFIGSRFTLHASSPHSVTLMQLRFTPFAVINLRRDLHPQECAHAGRTKKNGAAPRCRAVLMQVQITCACS